LLVGVLIGFSVDLLVWSIDLIRQCRLSEVRWLSSFDCFNFLGLLAELTSC
jgi:hypothetical protein